MLIQNGSRSENWQQRVGTVRGADQYWTNYRLRTCLGGNNLPLWESGKDTAIFCLAWVPALLAHPSVTCSTVVKPNPLEKRKQVQLLPKSMHLRHLQPSPKRWWEAWSTALQTCLNMADIMDGEAPDSKTVYLLLQFEECLRESPAWALCGHFLLWEGGMNRKRGEKIKG